MGFPVLAAQKPWLAQGAMVSAMRTFLAKPMVKSVTPTQISVARSDALRSLRNCGIVSRW